MSLLFVSQCEGPGTFGLSVFLECGLVALVVGCVSAVVYDVVEIELDELVVEW